MTGMAFKRMYIDIPTETHNGLVDLAAERGMSQKGLVAELINEAVADANKPKPRKKTTRKTRGKK